MKKLMIMAAVALCMASCSTTNNDDKKADQESAKIDGKWQLSEYCMNDSVVKVDPENVYYLTFNPTDSTFSMNTDCNGIGGKFVASKDSIMFDNVFSTRMMCQETSVEDTMNGIFASNVAYKVKNDSVLQLDKNSKTVATFVKSAAATVE